MIWRRIAARYDRWLHREGLRKGISPEEAYERICRYLGRKRPMGFLYEFEKVYGVRLRPGDYLCVVKETGEVMRGEDLPDDLYPRDIGKVCFIRKN